MTQSVTGTIAGLGQWFTRAKEISEEWSERILGCTLREELSMECSQFTEFGIHDGKVIVRTPTGRCIIEPGTGRMAGVFIFHFVRNRQPGTCWESAESYRFWFNKSSISHLGDALRAAPEKRVSFDSIFLND